jgi:hypothetical protein
VLDAFYCFDYKDGTLLALMNVDSLAWLAWAEKGNRFPRVLLDRKRIKNVQTNLHLPTIIIVIVFD